MFISCLFASRQTQNGAGGGGGGKNRKKTSSLTAREERAERFVSRCIEEEAYGRINATVMKSPSARVAERLLLVRRLSSAMIALAADCRV